ncbi:MAG: glycosyltransferase [Anaerolineae bacterium]|nr:glycosyltransferase [Anaerolineae bacterium]
MDVARPLAGQRILFLTPQLLYPPQQGGALRAYNLLAGLAARHTIHLLTFLQAGEHLAPDSPLLRLCARVEAVPAPLPRPLRRRLAATLLSPLPDMALRLPSPEFSARLAGLLSQERYDVVQAESLEMAPFLLQAGEQARGALLVFDDFNAEYLLQQRAWETDARAMRRWPGALYSWVQWHKIRRYEAQVCQMAGLVIAVSEADATALKEIAPAARVAVVPNGVDTAYFNNDPATSLAPATTSCDIVFTGKMDFRPNVDAALWFVREVLPRVRAEEPAARFLIIGQNPHARLRALAGDPAVKLTGRVPDVRPYVAAATVYVVPMRIGGGTRLKVLEAMAMGKAIVSTSLGCEGYPVRDGVEFVIADAPAEFARAVVALLRDPARRLHLGLAAREFAVSRYDWRAIAPRLEAAHHAARAEV